MDNSLDSAIAHSRNALGVRHSLRAHLLAVAELCASFAEPLGAGELGHYLGLWHDVGKFSSSFQEYLARCEAEPGRRFRGPDHKAAGTHLAMQHAGLAGLIVQGHHGGIGAKRHLPGWLKYRQTDPTFIEALRRAEIVVPSMVPGEEIPLPDRLEGNGLDIDLFLRLLFATLVDADYLDTERHFHPATSGLRAPDVAIGLLWEMLERAQSKLSGHAHDVVSRTRHEIYRDCIAAADYSPGLFRLAVPTGGGKTRSAMAFALRHALRHGQRRVIVAVPFITITEQTAEVYRGIFESSGLSVVLEHHSASEQLTDDDDLRPAAAAARLAAENWDTAIVVTTTVQLFDSLFSGRTGPSRKLHRLANSVIILDEVQALPPHLLETILDALQQLCRHYGATVVLSTATQPAFEAIPGFATLRAIDIIPEPARHFEALRRVEYEWRTDHSVEWSEVAEWVRAQSQALVVVNTKRDAMALLDELSDRPDVLHLSTLLCSAHRRTVLDDVKRRLTDCRPCLLISTQVVEAGVHVDFPFAFRAFGPLDSIAQVAGRCNREGKLGPRGGKMVIFRPRDGHLPPGVYRIAVDIAESLLSRGPLDLDDPTVFHTYFSRLFPAVDTDRDRLRTLRIDLDFPEVGARFHMVDEITESVIVEYDDGARPLRERLVDQLRTGTSNSRLLLRQLQPWMVSVRTRDAEHYRQRGLLVPISDGIGEWHGRYDPVRGLQAEGPRLDTFVV